MFELGAFGYDLLTRQPYWRNEIAGLLELLGERRPGLRVLDLGCGPGVSSFVLAERLGPAARVVGVDFAARMLERARAQLRRRSAELPHVRFQQADAAALPFRDGAFDVALGHSFLYLVRDRAAVLREVRRVLAPGGALVLMEPSAAGSLARAAWHALSRARGWWRQPLAALRFATSMALWRGFSAAAGRLSPEMLVRLLDAAGFGATEIRPTLAGLGLRCAARVPRPRVGASLAQR